MSRQVSVSLSSSAATTHIFQIQLWNIIPVMNFRPSKRFLWHNRSCCYSPAAVIILLLKLKIGPRLPLATILFICLNVQIDLGLGFESTTLPKTLARADSPHCWGKYHCTAGLQFYKFGQLLKLRAGVQWTFPLRWALSSQSTNWPIVFGHCLL